MVKVRKNIVSKSVASRVTYGGRNPINYIVIHETANTSKGANADAHGRLQANGNSRQASWHYTVDDKETVQSFDDRAQCWHAGNRKYNQQSIGIEICVNSDGDFKKAVDNAVGLTKQLMRKYNVPSNRVIQHNHASGKDCPRYLRAGNKGVTWTQFKSRLSKGSTSKSKTSTKKTSSKTSKKSTYKGSSVVDYLKSIGQSSSFNHRKKLAQQHGIKNYKGTASQNTRLLKALRGKKTSSNKTTKKSSTKYPLPKKILRRGNRGNSVRQLQRALNAANFKVGKVDGIYGAKTEDAVRRFQKVYDAYNVDGIYGSRTRSRLNKKIN